MSNSLVLILTLCLLRFIDTTTVVPESKTGYLTLRDEEFVGPDKRLEDEIEQRRKCHHLLLEDITALEAATPIKAWDLENEHGPQSSTTTRPPTQLRRTAPQIFYNNSRRTAGNPIFKDYDAEDIKPRMLQFQQHVILLTQDRLKDVSSYVQNLETDERFRLPFIFNKLENWLQVMRQLYQIERQNTAWTQRGIRTLMYYQRMLRHNIDITYTVAFLKHIHSRYMEIVRSRTGMTAEETHKFQKLKDLENSMSGNTMNEDEFKDIMQDMQKEK